MTDPASIPQRHFASSVLACAAALSFIVAILAGCVSPSSGVLPGQQTVVRDQLVLHTDFNLPKRHRLLEELAARRDDISSVLDLPTSDEPIDVYLFENRDKFRSFLTRKHPSFPDRRALFVKNDTSLNVFAYWGDRIGEDLRHEVTHGYLHSVVPNLPLWIDEGIAEYFEAPRGKEGFNHAHIYLLANRIRRGEWVPDMVALEKLKSAEKMDQLAYAESWLWVHFFDSSQCRNSRIVTTPPLSVARKRKSRTDVAASSHDVALCGRPVVGPSSRVGGATIDSA